MAEQRLAVLGSPIAHSKSPRLHAAAYEVLGLDWSYEAVEVTERQLASFVAGLDTSWRGLSLTMPLKREVIGLLDEAHPFVGATGAANTLFLDGDVRRGFNTDVYGITRTFREHGLDGVGEVVVLGAGATAGSAIVAARELGAHTVTVVARDARRAAEHLAGATAPTAIATFDEFSFDSVPGAVVNSLPNGVAVPLAIPEDVRAGSALFDVTYDPWPTAIAADWRGPVMNGLEMLVHQALQQVRIFVGGSPDAGLPDEARVLGAMRASVGLAPAVGG